MEDKVGIGVLCDLSLSLNVIRINETGVASREYSLEWTSPDKSRQMGLPERYVPITFNTEEFRIRTY